MPRLLILEGSRQANQQLVTERICETDEFQAKNESEGVTDGETVICSQKTSHLMCTTQGESEGD